MSFDGMEFKECRLDDIAEIHNSKRIPLNSRDREKRKGIYPYYGASGVVDYLDSYLFDGEYVLVSEDGENLRSRNTPIAFKADGKFWVNNHAHILKGKEPLINDYIVYYFSNLDLNPYVTGAVQPKLNKENLLSIPIRIPKDRKKRDQLVSILKSLDEKIELNRQTNQTLEAIAQAIFKEWFVDFNFPGVTSEMQDSELGQIPKGWNVESLDTIADFLNGLALQKYPPKNDNDVLPVIKIRELKNGITASTDKASKTIPQKYIIDDGDLLFSWSGTLEVKFWIGGMGALNQHLFKVTSSKYPIWFCYLWTLHHLNEFRKIAEDKTTTMGHIQRRHLTEALCLIPNDLESMDKVIKPLFEQYINLEQQIKTLTQLRDSLLPKLMKGEIAIK